MIRRGDHVLLKPNLLKPSHPDAAVTTHPKLILTIAQMCLDLGAHVTIGDSPGFFSLKKVAQSLGLTDPCKKMNIKIQEFRSPVPRKSIRNDHTLKQFKHDRLMIESDVIINLPKLKSHQQLALTGAIKNLYGCIPGKRKAKYHYQFGDRDNLFAEMLIENYELIRPTFTLVDAIVAMEGNGPARGRPKNVGLLIAGKDAVSIDRILCEIIGLPPELLRTLTAAKTLGVGNTELENIELVGALLGEIKVRDFLKAQAMPIKFELTRVIRSIVRNLYYRYFKEKTCQESTVLQ